MHSETLLAFQMNSELYETLTETLISKVPSSGVFVDGGAHVGRHTMRMLERADATRVHAIEAIPDLCDKLESRFGADARFKLSRAALGQEAGSSTFSIAVNAPGYSGLIARDIDDVRSWQAIEVEVVVLDDVVQARERSDVSLIKLDLEGGEYHAIVGARRTLTESDAVVVFENGLRKTADLYQYAWSDFDRTFSELGMAVYDFFGDRVDEDYWMRPLRTYMFVAVKADGRAHDWVRTEIPAFARELAMSSDDTGRR